MKGMLLTPWLIERVAKTQVLLAGRKAKRGQGVIEYAGALVIAAVLVAAVINVGPDAITGLFTQILGKVQSFFTSKMPT
jgi:Flp pilus assembly pilin Flp